MSDSTKFWTDRSLLEQSLIIATICLTIMMIGFSIGVASLRTQRSDLEAKVSELAAANDELETEISSLQDQVNELNSTVIELEDQLAHCVGSTTDNPWPKTTTTTKRPLRTTTTTATTGSTKKWRPTRSFLPQQKSLQDIENAKIRDARNKYGWNQKIVPVLPSI